MADDETETQTAAAPAPAPAALPPGMSVDDLIAVANKIAGRQMAPPTGTPDDGTRPSWTGLLGSVLGGGQAPGYQLRGGQADTSGNRALLNFGINTLLASGPHAVRPDVLSAVATGLQGAQESLGLDQRLAGAQTATAFEQNRQQQQDKLARIKEAIPLLTLQGQLQRAQAAAKLAGGGSGGGAPNVGSVGPDTYVGAIGGHEGTGSNPNSSATGPGQFIDSTWNGFAQANPDFFKGMSPQQVLDARKDPTFMSKVAPVAIEWLAKQNADDLTKSGVTPSGPLLGIAHYLGSGPAAAIANAQDGAPVSNFVSAAALNANPELARMTVGQMKARYASTPDPAFMQAAKAAPPPGQTAAAPPPAPQAGQIVPPAPVGQNPGAKVPIPPPVVPPVAPTVQTAGPGVGTDTPPTPQPPPVQLPDINVAGVTFRHPGTSADFQAKEYMPPPATEDLNPNLSPQTLAGFNIRRQQLQLAQQQAQLLNPPDIPKALIDIKAKQADLEAEAQNAAQAKALSAAEKLSTYNAAQRKEIQTRYDNQITAYNGAATAQQASGNKIAEINAQSDAQANGKSLEDLNKATDAARDVVTQGQMALELSKAAGQPDFLTRNPKVADILTSAGMLPAGETSQLGAQRALDTTLSGLILKLKNEGGMSRFTDRDLTFLQNTAGSSFTPEQFRTGMLSAIISAGQRQKQYGTMVQTLHGKGVPIYDARNQADQELGSIIQQPPAYANITDPQARLAAQGQWVNENVPVGSFYKKPNGKLGIRSPPPQQQGQQ